MRIYNIMTGTGFDTAVFGNWSMAWLGLAITFFIILFANKWIAEFVEWNSLIAFFGGILLYLIVITLTGVAAWSIAGGVVGLLAGGIVGGFILGGTE